MTEDLRPQELLHTVFDSIEAIFFHIPKCGGGTVLRTLEARLGRPSSFNREIKKRLRRELSAFLAPKIGRQRAQRFARGHVTYEIGELVVPPEVMDGYFKFVFVRGPYDRLFSAWNDLTRSHSTMLQRFRHTELKDFNVFVKTRLREDVFVDGEINEAWLDQDTIYIHFYPQFLFACKDGEIRADFIGRLESFTADFENLAVRLGLGDVPMVTRHVKYRGNLKTASRYLDRYDQESIEIVNELYGRDFELFGYERR
jgi:hypothetical protein